MIGHKNALRLLVALLVVGSVIPAPAVAQSDNEYSHQYTGGPQKVVVDQSNISGDFTVTVSTNQATGAVGEKTLLQRVQLGPGAEQDIVYDNYGAYDNITLEVTVHGSGEPSFEQGEGAIKVPYNIGHTGGDRDLRCDEVDKLYSMTNPGVTITDCTPPVGNGNLNTTNTDAEQIKLDIYQSAQNEKASSEVYQTTLDNYLEDTKTQARIIGKNAYIRALNNGSSKAAAKTAAKDAVADYYATKQANLAKKWGQQVANFDYLHGVAENETGVDSSTDRYVAVAGTTGPDADHYPEYTGTGSTTLDLANGSSTSVAALEIFHDGNKPTTRTVGPKTESYSYDVNPDGSLNYTHYVDGVEIKAPDDNHDRLLYLDFDQYGPAFSEIQSQNDAVQADMDTLANNTYDEYQSGEINNTDLVDPYVLSNEFSAGDEYQSWTAAQLTLLGTNSPEAMSNMGEFNVTTAGGTTHTGILMSQTNPDSGLFEVNTTHDTANITGPQFVVTADRLVELDGEFTIDSIENTDGKSRQNATIEKTTYEEADVNVTALIEGYEQLQEQRAEWEAREQNMRGGAGGFAFGNSTSLGILAALAGGLLLLNNRDEGGPY